MTLDCNRMSVRFYFNISVIVKYLSYVLAINLKIYFKSTLAVDIILTTNYDKHKNNY